MKEHPDRNRLSVEQDRVMNALAQAGTLEEVASKSGVDVTTICKWLECDTDFEQRYRLKVREREENARLARLQLVEQAQAGLSYGMYDNPRLAFTVLKEMGEFAKRPSESDTK